MSLAAEAVLPQRWHPAHLSPMQLAYLRSTARVNLVVAGRRSFKTEAAKRRVVRSAMTFSAYPDGHFFATAPTWDQAKKVFWRDVKALSPRWAVDQISNGELWIRYRNGAVLTVTGLDKPQRLEGVDWDGGVVTEYGNCRPNVYGEIIRPMLMRGGYVDIEGVPEGRNHYYDLAMEVQDGKHPRAAYHTWTTEEVLHLWLGEEQAREEIADAQASMDSLLYQQEYLARFIALEGQAYYAFASDLNVASGDRRVLYDPERPLILCFDFNRNPGVALYIQEHPLDRYRAWGIPLNARRDTVTACVGEVWIPRRSNTRKVAQRVVGDWAGIHRGEILLYGDATGGAKTTQAVAGSDWEIVRETLRAAFGPQVRSRVPRSNPPVRSRVNAMNTRLVAADGSVGMLIDARGCPNLIRDLEGVQADDAGEIVKEQGGPLTHISDAAGYYVAEKFPCGGPKRLRVQSF